MCDNSTEGVKTVRLKRSRTLDKDWQIIEETVEKIIKRSIHKHTFGYFERDDIAQEMRLIALEAFKGYTKSRGKLENYLARSIRNRIKVNLKRDKGYLVQLPCISHKCYFYDKKLKDCKWDKTRCLDWAKYETAFSAKCAVNSPSTYPSDDSVVTTDLDINSQLNEMLSLAVQRKLACSQALDNHLKFGQDIPHEHTQEVTELALEVAH